MQRDTIQPYQVALNGFCDQISDQRKVQAAFLLADLVPTLGEAEKRYVRGRIHRFRLDEYSVVVEEYMTLLLVLLDDVTVLSEAEVIFRRCYDVLPRAFQQQMAAAISSMQGT